MCVLSAFQVCSNCVLSEVGSKHVCSVFVMCLPTVCHMFTNCLSYVYQLFATWPVLTGHAQVGNQLQPIVTVHATECNQSCSVLVVVTESVQNPKTGLGLVVPKMVMKTGPNRTLKHYLKRSRSVYLPFSKIKWDTMVWSMFASSSSISHTFL